MLKLEVSHAELASEVVFSQPEFGLLQDTPALLDTFYRRLAPHGLSLGDMRMEGVPDAAAERHVLLSLINATITIRVRLDKVEVAWARMPRDQVEQFKTVTVDAVRALTDYKPSMSFRALTAAVALHGALQGTRAHDYLGRFIANVPQNLGPHTGTGVAFYFGAEGDRFFSRLVADVSALVPDGVFIRVHAAWDARHVSVSAMPGVVEAYVSQALGSLGIETSG